MGAHLITGDVGGGLLELKVRVCFPSAFFAKAFDVRFVPASEKVAENVWCLENPFLQVGRVKHSFHQTWWMREKMEGSNLS